MKKKLVSLYWLLFWQYLPPLFFAQKNILASPAIPQADGYVIIADAAVPPVSNRTFCWLSSKKISG